MTFKPGKVQPGLPAWNPPKWAGAEKNERDLPVRPSTPKEVKPPEGTQFVAAGVTIATAEQVPNKRGKGGRPSKAQERDEGKLKGAAKALEEVREVHPPTNPVPVRPSKAAEQRRWEKEYEEEEDRVEREEAEANLRARQDRLNALRDETQMRRISRSAAIGFGGTAIRLIGTMTAAASELDARVKENPRSLSIKELQATIQLAASTVRQASGAMELAARMERMWVRSPLEPEATDLGDAPADPAAAKVRLENVLKSLQAAAHRHGITVLDTKAEETDSAEVQPEAD